MALIALNCPQTDGWTDGRYQVHYLPCFAVDKYSKANSRWSNLNVSQLIFIAACCTTIMCQIVFKEQNTLLCKLCKDRPTYLTYNIFRAISLSITRPGLCVISYFLNTIMWAARCELYHLRLMGNPTAKWFGVQLLCHHSWQLTQIVKKSIFGPRYTTPPPSLKNGLNFLEWRHPLDTNPLWKHEN